MAVNNIIKRIQNIMRQDAGINGDAQRIEQMTWMRNTSPLSPRICVGVTGQ